MKLAESELEHSVDDLKSATVAQSKRGSTLSTASSTASLVSKSSKTSKHSSSSIKRVFSTSFRNKSLKYLDGRFRMRALVLLMASVMVLAALQAGYLVVDARREKRVGRGQGDDDDDAPQEPAGDPRDLMPFTSRHSINRSEIGLKKLDKSLKRASQGGSHHHHHHHRSSHHGNDAVAVLHDDVMVVKHIPEPFTFQPKESRAKPTSTSAPSDQGEPLEVHISVERVNHQEPATTKESKPSSPTQRAESAVTMHAVEPDAPQPQTIGGAPSKPGKGRRDGGHHHVRDSHSCDDDSQCPTGECCLPTHNGRQVCKRGGYKTHGRHCITSCVCKTGLECVHKPPKVSPDVETPLMGRCKARKALSSLKTMDE